MKTILGNSLMVTLARMARAHKTTIRDHVIDTPNPDNLTAKLTLYAPNPNRPPRYGSKRKRQWQ